MSFMVGSSTGTGVFGIVLSNGTAKVWGDNQKGARGLNLDSGVWGIYGDSSGEMAALGVIEKVRLCTRTVGIVQLGQYEDAATLTSLGRTIKYISFGYDSSAIILDDGKLCMSGENTYGKLGRGTTSNTSLEKQTYHEVYLGSINGDGSTTVGGTGGDLKAVDVMCGVYHVLVLTDDSTGNGYKIKGFGHNEYGQLCRGDTTTRIGNSAATTGDNVPFADLGTVNGNGTGGALTAKSFGGVGDGGWASMAILSNDKVKAWGRARTGPNVFYGNTSSRVGDNIPYIELGAGRTAKQVNWVSQSGVILLDNGAVKGWSTSNNTNGLLGLGNTTNYADPYTDLQDLGVSGVSSALCTNLNILLVFNDGTIKICGANGQGILLKGNTTSYGSSAGETWANQTAINLGLGKSLHSADYKKSVVLGNAGASVIAFLNRPNTNTVNLATWGSGTNGALGQDSTTNRGSAGGETTPFYISVTNIYGWGSGLNLNWIMPNPDSVASSVTNAMADSTNGIRTGVASTRNTNFVTLSKSYRDAVTATTITEVENTKRRKQLRREMRTALGSDDNISYTDTTEKTNLIATSSSSNTGLIDTSFPLNAFFPDPDNSSTIDISSVDLDSTNIYIDIVASEAITVTTNTGSQTWTMNSDGDGVTIVNESSSSNAYALGDSVGVGSYTIKLFMFGSVGGGSSGGGSGGDPYVCPMIGEPYKLPNGKEYFRLFDTNINDSNDRLILNCFADYCSNTDNEQNYIDKRIKDYNLEKLYVNQKNLKDLTFYKYGYIQYGQNSIYIDMYDLKLYNRYKSMELKENELTEDEYPEWLTVDYNDKYTQHTLLSKITKLYNFEESRYMKISIKTESHGNCSFKFHKYINPQIRTGVLFRIGNTNNISGALVRQLNKKDVILKKLTDKKYIKNINYKPDKNRIISEIFYDKSNREKIKILVTDMPSKTDRFYAKVLM
jgi:hypothetical protein